MPTYLTADVNLAVLSESILIAPSSSPSSPWEEKRAPVILKNPNPKHKSQYISKFTHNKIQVTQNNNFPPLRSK